MNRRIEGHSAALASMAIAIALVACRAEGDRISSRATQTETRLASAGIGAGEAATRSAEVSLQRLSATDQVAFYTMAISPTGRHLSRIDGGDLAVQDLLTGRTHRLTRAHRSGEYPGGVWEEAGVSAFSDDGRHIAYTWARSNGRLQLRTIDFELDDEGVPRRAEPRVVYENEQFAPYYVFDWSPDGQQILVLGYPGGGAAQLALISVADGSRAVLKSFDWREPLRAVFSPDGAYIAYDYRLDVESPDRDVYVLSLDGANDQKVVDGPAVDRLLGWSADGNILFHSDRADTPGVWRIAISGGRAVARAELVKADMWGVDPIGLAGSRLYYGVDVNPQRFYTAAIDLETGQLTSPAEPVDDPARIHVRAWDWSRDGELLAYAGSTGGVRAALFGTGPSMIVILNDRGEEVQTMEIDLGRPSRLRWAPDGRSLIVWARDTEGRRGFRRIDLETGSSSLLVRADATGITPHSGHFDISPDGSILWFARRGVTTEANPLMLMAHELAGGTAKPIARLQHDDEGFVAASPDGTRLALITPDSPHGTISTIPVDGGPATPLYEIPEDTRVIGLDWTRNGASLVFSTSRAGEPWRTWIVSTRGGEARLLQLGDHVNPRELSLQPNGSRIGFLAGESRGEVWLMSGIGRQADSDVEESGGPS